MLNTKRKTQMTAKQKKQYDSLSHSEKKIYNAIKEAFSLTSHDSCYDYSIQRGISFQFISK